MTDQQAMPSKSSSWPSKSLEELLVQDTDFIGKLEQREYPKLSVKLYGRGVYLDTPADGASVLMSRHQLAKAGQVIVSEIWGKKGAIGIVPPEGENALCTSHFYLFDVKSDAVHPSWLKWLIKANYFEPQLEVKARGSTGYAATRPHHFLSLNIPYPSPSEQQCLVTKLDFFAAQIVTLRQKIDDQLADAERLLRSFIFDRFDTCPTPMDELVYSRSLDTPVDATKIYPFAGVYSFGRGVFRSSLKSGMDFAYPALTRVRAGDFTYPKLMAWEGAFGIVPPECDGCFVSPEFPVFEVRADKALPEVLDVYFRTPTVWPGIAGASTGTNARRRRLQPSAFLAWPLPLPPMPVQKRLREAKRRVDAFRLNVSAQHDNLNALMASLLDHAFQGKL